MKSAKIVFWITTIMIFLFEGVMTALTFNSDMAQTSMRHLGYPSYFSAMLMVFKVLGSLALVIPAVPGRVKEWAYAGFGIDFICAFISLVAVDGFTGTAILPLVFVGILAASYVNREKMMMKKA